MERLWLRVATQISPHYLTKSGPGCNGGHASQILLHVFVGTSRVYVSGVQWDSKGIPFRQHMYVPEIHPHTQQTFQEREDEPHILKVCYHELVHTINIIMLFVNTLIAISTRGGQPQLSL